MPRRPTIDDTKMRWPLFWRRNTGSAAAAAERHPLTILWRHAGAAVDPVIRLLRDLVAIDSVNPSLVPGAAGEKQIAEAIGAHMTRIGLDVELHDAAPGRPNVVGVLE